MKSKIEQKEDHREALLNTIEALIDINFKILKLLDKRLTALEDQVELFETKKEGKLKAKAS